MDEQLQKEIDALKGQLDGQTKVILALLKHAPPDVFQQIKSHHDELADRIDTDNLKERDYAELVVLGNCADAPRLE